MKNNIDVESIKSEEEALDQSMAVNRIAMQLLKDRAQDCKRLWIALIVSILVNLCSIGGFLWYESQWEYETVTETTSVVQDANELGSNNIYQSGENAVYNNSIPEVNNGETNNNS